MARKKFTVTVNYKSGRSETFDVYEFAITDGVYSWECIEEGYRPLVLNPSEIESVWYKP